MEKRFEKIADMLCQYAAANEDEKGNVDLLLGFMENYEEPVLPFSEITPEMVAEAFRKQEERYGYVLWTNEMAGSDTACAEIVQSDPDYYIGFTEEEIRQITYENCGENYDIMKSNLMAAAKPFEGLSPLVIIGRIGRWDGKKPVCVVKDSMEDILGMLFGNDQNTMYMKDGWLQAESIHHDGTNEFVIGRLEGDLDASSIMDLVREGRDLAGIAGHEKAIKSLLPETAAYYGWKEGYDDEKP